MSLRTEKYVLRELLTEYVEKDAIQTTYTLLGDFVLQQLSDYKVLLLDQDSSGRNHFKWTDWYKQHPQISDTTTPPGRKMMEIVDKIRREDDNWTEYGRRDRRLYERAMGLVLFYARRCESRTMFLNNLQLLVLRHLTPGIILLRLLNHLQFLILQLLTPQNTLLHLLNHLQLLIFQRFNPQNILLHLLDNILHSALLMSPQQPISVIENIFLVVPSPRQRTKKVK